MLLPLPLSAWAAETQTLELVVAAAGLPAGAALYAETTWVGETRRTRLTEVPSGPEGVSLGARWSGEPARSLAIRVFLVDAEGVSTLAWTGAPDLLGSFDRLSFVVGSTQPLTLLPVLASPVGAAPLSTPSDASLAGAGWAALVFLYVMALLGPLRLR